LIVIAGRLWCSVSKVPICLTFIPCFSGFIRFHELSFIRFVIVVLSAILVCNGSSRCNSTFEWARFATCSCCEYFLSCFGNLEVENKVWRTMVCSLSIVFSNLFVVVAFVDCLFNAPFFASCLTNILLEGRLGHW